MIIVRLLSDTNQRRNTNLLRLLGGKGVVGIDALVEVLTHQGLVWRYTAEATTALTKAAGRPAAELMADRGYVNHIGRWVRPEQRTQLLKTLQVFGSDDRSSWGERWKVEVLEANYRASLMASTTDESVTYRTEHDGNHQVLRTGAGDPSAGKIQAREPIEGHVFLVVQLQVENLDPGKANQIGMWEFVVSDESGQAYIPVGHRQGSSYEIVPGMRKISWPGGSSTDFRLSLFVNVDSLGSMRGSYRMVEIGDIVPKFGPQPLEETYVYVVSRSAEMLALHPMDIPPIRMPSPPDLQVSSPST